MLKRAASDHHYGGGRCVVARRNVPIAVPSPNRDTCAERKIARTSEAHERHGWSASLANREGAERDTHHPPDFVLKGSAFEGGLDRRRRCYPFPRTSNRHRDAHLACASDLARCESGQVHLSGF